MKTTYIYYLMGKSGSGKDTLYNLIRHVMQELKPIVMYTDRPKREGEIDGETYHFVSTLPNHPIIEKRNYETVSGPKWYATLDDGQIEEGSTYIAIGTPISYYKLTEYLTNKGSNIKVWPILLDIDDKERLRRCYERECKEENPDFEELIRRFLSDEDDFTNFIKSGNYHRINNDNVYKALQEILDIIEYYTYT